MTEYLDFEKPLIEIEERIVQLKEIPNPEGKVLEEISKLQKRSKQALFEIYSKLTPWQKVQVARHIIRPTFLDYIKVIFENPMELHGDRLCAEDKSIIGGLAKFKNRTIVFVGNQKGKTLKERVQRNFGMPNPEGYRKALRLMKMADKFKFPVITMVDTPGAFPGIGAEERGQSEAIARNLFEMSRLSVPIISIVIGEGGSGGALALSVADKIIMLEHAVFSVISPEGCAAILWKESGKMKEATEALRMTAQELYQGKVIDEILLEPLGGAHRNPKEMAETCAKCIETHLTLLESIPPEKRLALRYEKFKKLGPYLENTSQRAI
ncbi:MAG: acetyl-CoA carboxylase carboxyltransferase subunit alpha [Nitrospirae bacterium]|nr:acetyl-CoA carboxylase carboxyltransferase subunit alpha [Nitrospirota bacterium]MBI3351927.1 acetyl-CoA carboxylase carboxyltransferase subunit alpha [Nitrospirota bacterium]